MNYKIYKIARKNLRDLLRSYREFNYIFLDDWRGPRFVYDVDEIKNYPGKRFLQSRLYQLLNKEKPGIFTIGLLKASKEDKKIFGNEYFLNCKTFDQFSTCYAKFLSFKAVTKKEILAEMKLLKNVKIIYAKKGNRLKLEKEFRKLSINKAIENSTGEKRRLIVVCAKLLKV